MKEIEANENLVAYCGLYCGSCTAFLKEKCLGCIKNEKASWCEIRKCNAENEYRTCGDCTIVSSTKECKKFENLIAKAIGFFTGTDRGACVEQIKKEGIASHASIMAEKKLMSLKKSR